ncbi:MAG: flagellar biosynthesis protein FliQ [Rhodothermales bacterium]|nr:flagellar biosynthesis protein FliQ [Rhodothermales bacterium]
MTADVALYWVQQAMQLAVMLAGPLLLAALAVGIVVSLFQAVTSMQEMTLSYIPKIAIVGGVLLFLTPWMLQMMTDFATRVFTFIPSVSF